MGGSGSGRPRTKTVGTTDQFLSLDIHDLWRRGILMSEHPCTIIWHSSRGTVRGSIGLWAGLECVWLSYSCVAHIHEPIPVQYFASRSNAWGRPYFRCPTCQRLAVKLYLVEGHFRCRRCHRLAYASQSEDELGRARRRLITVQRQLGGPLGLDLHAPTPERPAGMRHRQYYRLLREAGVAEADLARELLAWLRKRWGLLGVPEEGSPKKPRRRPASPRPSRARPTGG
jgi:hypothetical protein